MKVYKENNNLIVSGISDFDLEQTFECGQCFRWEKCGEGYAGVAYGRALKIAQREDSVILYDTSIEDWDKLWRRYFDADRDYSEIKRRLSQDSVMKSAVNFGGGIRILNQEPFECLISFIISASNNIPRIKGIIQKLCLAFGEKITYCGEEYHAFPSAERLAALTLDDLSVIKAGFRDKYILNAAKAVTNGQTDLECLLKADSAYAKSELLKLSGVGNKVADCVLLFGLGKHESYPIDVWIKRVTEQFFFDGRDTPKEVISKFAAEKFGEFGGFAQQYLFYAARENKIGT